MISTRLMAPGEFTIRLDRPPEWVRALTDRPFSVVLVLPGKVTNPAKVGITQLLADAWYHGVLVARAGVRDELHGYGMAYLLKLAAQPSDQSVSKRPLYNGPGGTSWVRNNVLRVGVGENQGLEAGPIMVAAGASTPTKGGEIPAGQEPLETLADVARRFGKEWDVRDGYQLEVAGRSDLFRVTPTVMATPKATGADLNLDALASVSFTERDDWEDYASEVAVPFTPPDFEFGVDYAVGDTVVATDGTFYECNSAHTSSGANLPPSSKWTEVDPYGTATASTSYVSPLTGTDVVARTVVTARNATTYDDATTIAEGQAAKLGGPHRAITMDTRTYGLNRIPAGIGKVRAGDNVYAFASELGLVDATAQVLFGGRPVPAATVRVQGIDTNVDSSMSVLVYSWDGSAAVVDDVSRWVAWEEAGQTLHLGQPRRRRAGQVQRLVSAAHRPGSV